MHEIQYSKKNTACFEVLLFNLRADAIPGSEKRTRLAISGCKAPEMTTSHVSFSLAIDWIWQFIELPKAGGLEIIRPELPSNDSKNCQRYLHHLLPGFFIFFSKQGRSHYVDKTSRWKSSDITDIIRKYHSIMKRDIVKMTIDWKKPIFCSIT